MLKFLFVAVSFFIIFEGKACPEATEIEEIHTSFKVVSYKSVWPGFANQNLVFAFTMKSSGTTVLVGATHSEIQRANVNFEECDLGNEITSYQIEGVDLPVNGLYGIRLLNQPGTDILAKYVQANSQPVVQIQQPNNHGLNSTQVARTVIHEAFHGIYQFGSKVFVINSPQPRNFLNTCAQNLKWIESTLRQNKILSDSLHTDDQVELKKMFNEIKNERALLAYDEASLSCLKAQRFWERLEGSAHYVETEAALKAGLLKKTELISELEKVLLAPDIRDNFFYQSGNALIRLLITINGEGTFNEIDADNFMIVPSSF